ncbi:MAG: putative sugar O-methyltransferase [Chloroflexota bacterium]|nr:putative sugar O-methyltransferase [Chloroflexota bacterium]|tara:strand:+ start:112 stop:1212 length:1101 start_codon:yes stop_codon:yes gene_type:complete
MDTQILKKIEDFISLNQSKKEYISTHWSEIIKLRLANKNLNEIIDELKSSHYLEHYSLFKYTDNFIKHQDPKDKILFRKTLLSILISNPVLLIKVLKKIYKKSKSRDSIFLTQSLTLESIGILDDYFKFMEENKFYTDFSSQRLYFYNRVQQLIAQRYLNNSNDINFLEIGAGGGNSAIFLIKNNIVKNYVIVDLPEMLTYSAYHIHKNCDEFNIEFGPNKINNFNNESKTIFFLTPDQINLIPDKLIDFQFSINALMEMTIDISNRYVKEMYRIGANDSITMIIARINELTLKEKPKELNNPYTYKYSSDDKVISMGPDFLQDNSRSLLRSTPISPSMIRISKINSNSENIEKLNFHRILDFKNI